MNWVLIWSIAFAASILRSSSGSSVELLNDEHDEIHMTVESGRPETTYSGKLGIKANSWGYHQRLTQQYKGGEQFCFFAAVLGMRNFSCHILLSKYWDVDVEMTLRDSDGREIAKGSAVTSGKRSPYITLRYENIPRPDIASVCVQNLGAAKTVYHSIFLSYDQKVHEYLEKVNNMTADFNHTTEVLNRVENHVNEIATLSKSDDSSIMQDYFRMIAIDIWLNRRGIVTSLLMIFCSGGSTALIRRWFGTPRSTV